MAHAAPIYQMHQFFAQVLSVISGALKGLRHQK
jgi:hypothetical protein